jgi:hypothetical protein
MDDPTPVLIGSTVQVVGRQDVACTGSACGGSTYGTSGHVLDLTEPASSPDSGVAVTDLSAAAGVAALPASLSHDPAPVEFGGGAQVYTVQSTARNSAGGDIPLLQAYAQTSQGQWVVSTLNGVGGAAPFGEDGIGDPAVAADNPNSLNVLIDNASAPGNGYDLTGAGNLQAYRWTSANGWQFTDITAVTGSPLITAYPAAAAAPQGYLYAFAPEA